MRRDKCVQPCAKAINRVSNPKEVTHLNEDDRVNIVVLLALMPPGNSQLEEQILLLFSVIRKVSLAQC